MPRVFHAVLLLDRTETAIEGKWSDVEVVTLNRFLDQYEELAGSRPMQDGVPCGVTIRVAGGQAEVTTDVPSQDDLDILFQRLRLFVLNEERISFDNVSALLKRHLKQTFLRDFFKDQRRRFENDSEFLSGRVTFNGRIISTEDALKDWIYGYQFHGDDSRRRSFESHGIDVKHPTVRRTFVGLLLNKLDAVGHIAAVAAVLMGRHPCVAIYGATLSSATAR